MRKQHGGSLPSGVVVDATLSAMTQRRRDQSPRPRGRPGVRPPARSRRRATSRSSSTAATRARIAARPTRRSRSCATASASACATCSGSGRSPAATSRAAPPTSPSPRRTTTSFWDAHVKLMTRSATLTEDDLASVATDLRRRRGHGRCAPGPRARRGRHRERARERRARDADVLHQRPPLRRPVGRRVAVGGDAGLARPPRALGRGRLRELGAVDRRAAAR